MGISEMKSCKSVFRLFASMTAISIVGSSCSSVCEAQPGPQGPIVVFANPWSTNYNSFHVTIMENWSIPQMVSGIINSTQGQTANLSDFTGESMGKVAYVIDSNLLDWRFRDPTTLFGKNAPIGDIMESISVISRVFRYIPSGHGGYFFQQNPEAFSQCILHISGINSTPYSMEEITIVAENQSGDSVVVDPEVAVFTGDNGKFSVYVTCGFYRRDFYIDQTSVCPVYDSRSAITVRFMHEGVVLGSGVVKHPLESPLLTMNLSENSADRENTP